MKNIWFCNKKFNLDSSWIFDNNSWIMYATKESLESDNNCSSICDEVSKNVCTILMHFINLKKIKNLPNDIFIEKTSIDKNELDADALEKEKNVVLYEQQLIDWQKWKRNKNKDRRKEQRRRLKRRKEDKENIE